MKTRPHLVLATLVVILVALGAIQGSHIRHLRDSELFFRWILAEATQARLFDESNAPAAKPEEGALMDRVLFDKIADATENRLADVTVTDKDKTDAGAPLKRLVILAGNESQEQRVWDLARGEELAALRLEFLGYLRQGKLASVASQFDPSAVYGDRGADVSLGNIFFGFRKVAANFVWLQVDRYWHQGMMHRMIPLMKTCVTLDPNFVDAYLLGAWHLAYNATAKLPDTPEPLKKYNPRYGVRVGEKEQYYYMGADFLKDGIRKNPRNYKLYFDLGFSIYKIKLKDYPDAVKYLGEAIRQRHDRWVPRQLYICMELNGQYEDALAGWQDYLKNNPDSELTRETAPRFIKRNQARIKERDADAADARAQTDTDAANPGKAQTDRAEAAKLRDEALEIYNSMTDNKGEIDSFAMGRILRTKAMRLLAEERYLEAIAILENARWKSADLFEEASDMIMAIKEKAGIPLSTSEKKAVLREKEAEKYKNLSPDLKAQQNQ